MNTPLHIRHVNLARGFRGGERQTVLLIQALAALGLKQSLVCRRDSWIPAELENVAVSIIHADHQLAGHFNGGRADLVHAHEAKAVHWAYVHQRLRSTPYLLTRRVPQPVKDKFFNRRTYAKARCTVAISSVIETHLCQRNWGETARIPSALAHLPANAEQVDALKARFAHRFVVGHVGALVDRHKGQRLLIDAARQLHDSHPELLFLFLGEGEDEAALKRESADLDNVVWEGFKKNVGDYLEAMDLFAFPSRNEGLGSILLDVMDHDVPIVAAAVDGIPDIVIDDDSGVLVPGEDSTALAQAIAELASDAARRERLASGAKRRLGAFTPAAMASAYLTLYRRLLTR
ncbi:glycosyltransferase family 4 protein [Phytohalomonas tamaricis]|uniref:glycosyltransferase family 4 protein n=1 Tax=Phytohalomonas tamaricis TaxID=2081032 RepID=UPI000D0BDB95|nr:glycosyltransferase family 4 protein [Phytohalomonas tamaricis]